jgi:hypothetical protein
MLVRSQLEMMKSVALKKKMAHDMVRVEYLFVAYLFSQRYDYFR